VALQLGLSQHACLQSQHTNEDEHEQPHQQRTYKQYRGPPGCKPTHTLSAGISFGVQVYRATHLLCILASCLCMAEVISHLWCWLSHVCPALLWQRVHPLRLALHPAASPALACSVAW
jgi:hypothetical protein